jgi:hypothetical protein
MVSSDLIANIIRKSPIWVAAAAALYGKFLTLLQLIQTRTRSKLLLGPYPASWAIVANEPLTRVVICDIIINP